MLKRTLKIRLHPNKEQKNILRELQFRCACLWNKANYIIRQKYFNFGKILSYESVYNLVKNEPEYKNLPSDIAQAVLKKLSESWSSFKELKKLQNKGKLPKHIKKVSPPKYFKDRKLNQTLPMPIIPILSERSYSLKSFSFSMTIPKDIKKEYKIKNRLVVKATYKLPSREHKLKRAEVINKNGRWYVHIALEIPKEKVNKEAKTNFAAIDLGIRNLITLAVYSKEKKLVKVYQFKTKELLKEWKYFNRKIAEYQSKLIKSGHKGSSIKLRKLYEKRNRRIKVAVQNMTNKIVKILEKHNVKDVFIGDLVGIREGKDYGKNINKLLHNFWIRRQIIDTLKYKLEEVGIGLIPIPESYTSKICFNCSSKVVRPKQHYVKCPKCGEIHADSNGSINILKRGLKLNELDWKEIKEVHLVWRYKDKNKFLYKFLRKYKKAKPLVRGRANNLPWWSLTLTAT